MMPFGNYNNPGSRDFDERGNGSNMRAQDIDERRYYAQQNPQTVQSFYHQQQQQNLQGNYQIPGNSGNRPQTDKDRDRDRNYYERKDRRRSRSRSRSRSRRDSRSRSRDRERDRHRDRYSRSPSRSRTRSSRSRSRDRDRDYRRGRSRSGSPYSRSSRRRRSRSWSRDRDRNRGAYRDRGDEYSANRKDRRDSYHQQQIASVPSNKLALRDLPADVDRNAIAVAMMATGYIPQDIRVITKEKGGQMRTFGFIDFPDMKTASTWMDSFKGWLVLADGRQIQVEYAKNEMPSGNPKKGDMDWICCNCSMNNFFKRETCFKCDTSKETSMELERQGLHMVGVTPCDTLLIRNLPPNCLTPTIFDSLSKYTQLTSILQLQIADSQKFAYVQMKSTDEATLLLNASFKSPMKIGGKDGGSFVIVTYCRDSMTKLLAQQAAQAQREAQIAASAPTHAISATDVSGAEVAQAAMRAAQQRAENVAKIQTPGARNPQTAAALGIQPTFLPASLATIPQTNYSVPPPMMTASPTVMAGMPAISMTQMPGMLPMSMPPPMMASMGMVQMPYGHAPQFPAPTAVSSTPSPKGGIIGTVTTPKGVLKKYVPPNSAMFRYEPTSGYYHDPVTNFYYDPSSGYYFNGETQSWVQWDPAYQTYMPVDASKEPEPSTTKAEPQAAVISALPVMNTGSTDETNKEEPEVEEIPVNAAETATSNTVTSAPAKKSKKKEEAKEKTAVELAKDMEKWAKKQQKQATRIKMIIKPLPKSSEVSSSSMPGSSDDKLAPNELTLKMLEKAKNPLADLADDSDEDEAGPPPPVPVGRKKPSTLPVAAQVRVEKAKMNAEEDKYRARKMSFREQQEQLEKSLVDESKKMCLLCKRAFPSVDVLRKHVDKSDLHRSNLEQKRAEWRTQFTSGDDDEEFELPPKPTPQPIIDMPKYRDRAKERRMVYGFDAAGYAKDSLGEASSDSKIPGGGLMKSEEQIRMESEMASKRAIDETNIGNKLLKSMGWKEGQGVGKNAQGIINPIEAERYSQGVGLGASGSKIVHGVEATHQEKTKAALYSRYNQL